MSRATPNAEEPGKRTTTIQRSLLLNMVLLIALISGAILASVYLLGVKRSVQNAAMARIKNTEDTTEQRLQLLFGAVRSHLITARSWSDAGLLSVAEPRQLRALFIPALENTPYVSSMVVAAKDGRAWHLLRDGDAWLTRTSSQDGQVSWRRFTRPMELVDRWTGAPVPDPRKQVWYIGAMNTHYAESIYWTRPYAFDDGGEPGITASTRCDVDGDGVPETVVAFDMRLNDISDLTTGLYVSARGKTVVTTDDGALIGLPRGVDVGDSTAANGVVFSSIDQLGVEELTTANQMWTAEMQRRGEHFRFHSGGEAWWAGFRYFDIGSNRTLWIGVVVPEADFRAQADAWRNYTILITILALGVAAFMATILARRYGRPLKLLADASRSLRVRAEETGNFPPEFRVDLVSDVRAPHAIAGSGIREIDALADDFQRMALQVKRRSHALEQYSQRLEEMVHERTEDLNAKNLELVDTLAQLHEMQQQLLLQEKMASLGNLVAGVAHEVNSPIGAINGAADVTRRCIEKIAQMASDVALGDDLRQHPQFQRTLGVLLENNALIIEGGHRVSEIVKNLKNFSRLDEAELQSANIHEGIDSTLVLAQHMLKNRIEVVKNYGELPEIMCYPNELNQVFMNLFVNAAQAIDGAGTITVSSSRIGDVVHISVSDTGRGISPEHLDRIFDPGFTTKGVGVGTGLGLSISHRIVEKHGGSIYVQSDLGAGTTVTVTLPIAHAEA